MIHGIFDSHAHYDDARFDEDRAEMLKSLPENGVCGISMPDVTWNPPEPLLLCRGVSHVWAAAGFHPEQAASYTEEGLARSKKC